MTRRKTLLFVYFIFLLSWAGLANPSPQVNFLLTPTNGETGISIEPTFTWTKVIGATTYKLEIATTSAFASILFEQTAAFTNGLGNGTRTAGPYTEVYPNNTYNQINYPFPLGNNKLLYWRVTAFDINGATLSISDIWSFRT